MTSLRRIVITAAILFLLISLPYRSLTQTPTPVSRDALINMLKEQAHRDVENGRSLNVSDLNALYGPDAAANNLTPLEMFKIYNEEYSLAKNPSLWQKLSQLGWITAGVLAILLILRNVLLTMIESVARKIKDIIYSKLAGHPILRRTALRRYRLALMRKYQKLKVPFRPDRPLNVREIYVPLKVKGTSDIEQIDAFATIGEHRRLMVVGPPGSGKSMLLRHIALSYAEDRLAHLQDQPIPILLELSRLNDYDGSIHDALVEIFRLNDFPRAENFVNISMGQGRLMLLFDGLDEVNSDRRTQVVKVITDLLDEFERCRAIITCRTAVYRNEFSQSVEQTLEIVDFNDQQIQIFLKAWQPHMPAEKSVEQLIRTLRERPRIMSLARNPLLLTIIAYLYTDTDFVLPHSRTEFYDQAVDVLLRQWKEDRNHYKAAHKRLILQHLALFNQDGGERRNQDRRSIELKSVIEEIKRVLPSLNLAVEDASSVLDEIVERSSLMLSIDGGTRYQFAHLTLQEFFAADALRDDIEGLLKRYMMDSDAWRETVKLWCGLDLNSTELIRAIYETDPITAFECLADAQLVAPELAEEILNMFKTRIGASNGDIQIIKAFAAVASDLRPRGLSVFNFLTQSLENAPADRTTATLATALAYTNMPAAAEVLIRQYESKPEVRPALVWMGDIAVPMLSAMAQAGKLTTLDDLHAIGTPDAATALVPFLWERNNSQTISSALRLASLLSRPNVEAALRDYPLKKEQRAEYLKIWEPFNEPADSSLPIIAGRIAYLLNQYIQSPSYQDTIFSAVTVADKRIVVPLLIHIQSFRMITPHSLKELYNEPNREITNLLSKLSQYIPLNPEQASQNFNSIYQAIRTGHELLATRDPSKATDVVKHVYSDTPDASGLSTTTAALIRELLKLTHARPIARVLSLLPPRTQIDLFHRMVTEPVPTMEDWNNIFRPIKFKFKKSWHFSVALLLAWAMSMLGLLGDVIPQGESITNSQVWVFIGLFACMAITWARMLTLIYREQYTGEKWFSYALIVLLPPSYILSAIASVSDAVASKFDPKSEFKVRHLVLVILSCVFLISMVELLLLDIPGLLTSVVLLSIIAIPIALLLMIARAGLDTHTPAFGSWFDELNKELVMMLIHATIFLIYMILVVYFSSLYLLQYVSIAMLVLMWGAWIGVFFVVCLKGLKKDRAARNPLHGLLDSSLVKEGD